MQILLTVLTVNLNCMRIENANFEVRLLTESPYSRKNYYLGLQLVRLGVQERGM